MLTRAAIHILATLICMTYALAVTFFAATGVWS